MERAVHQSIRQESLLCVENKTHDKLLIRFYSAIDQAFYHRTIVPGECIDLPSLGSLMPSILKLMEL